MCCLSLFVLQPVDWTVKQNARTLYTHMFFKKSFSTEFWYNILKVIKPKLYHECLHYNRPVTILFQLVALLSCWTQGSLIQYVLNVHTRWMASVYCWVTFAASAFISEMSSRLIRNTKRRPAIWKDRHNQLAFCLSGRFHLNLKKILLTPSTHLHHWVVVQLPLVACKDRSAVNINGSSTLIGDEEVSVIFQFNYSCKQKSVCDFL